MIGKDQNTKTKSSLVRLCWPITGASALTLLSCPAYAQEPRPFVPIEGRDRPEYRSTPIRVGSFEIIPVVSADIEYVDNLFASAVAPIEDAVLTVTPTVTARDRRQDRNIQLQVRAGYETFLDNSLDDRLLLSARGNAQLGLGTATRPFAGLSYSQNDTRGRNISSFSETAQPLRLTTYGGNAGLQQDIGDFTYTVEGRYRATDYDGEIVLNGTTFDSGLRDFDSYFGRARVAYSRDRVQSFYLEGQWDKYDYSDPQNLVGLPLGLATDRSSNGAALSVGFARRITEVLQLDVNVGYLNQDYDDPAFDSIDTVSFDGNVFWNPSRLTTVQARAARVVQETTDPFFSGLLRTEFSLSIQHELRRNLVIGAEAQFANINLVDREDNGSETGFSGFVRYYASRNLSLRLRAERFDRNVIFPGQQNRVMFGTIYNF